jgi:hypothetical protein
LACKFIPDFFRYSQPIFISQLTIVFTYQHSGKYDEFIEAVEAVAANVAKMFKSASFFYSPYFTT